MNTAEKALVTNYSTLTTAEATYESLAPVPVTGITVNKSTAEITVGATVLPANATDKSYTWSSNNTDAATVDASGVVTAVAAGMATITATSASDNTKKASCTVTVKASATTTKWDNMSSMYMSVDSGSQSKTSNGVTVTVTSSGGPMDFGEFIDKLGSGYFTFSTSTGKISKIVITHTDMGSWMGANAGWPQHYYCYEGSGLFGVTSIEFTIE